MTVLADFTPHRLSVAGKLASVPWGLVLVMTVIAAVGVMVLYSIASGSWEPWAGSHAIRYGVALIIMLTIAVIDIRVWGAIAYPMYGGALILLIAVEIVGDIALGAQRWLDLGFIRLQPSEFMKIGMVLALARYYHDLPDGATTSIRGHIIPILMLALPAGLIMHQPDLGTALLVVGAAVVIIFLAGLAWKWVIAGGLAAATMVPLAFFFILHDYQRERVLTFLTPDRDPLGAGYHVTQSKIAIGNGGFFGQGFMQGSEAQLDFLPEKHTDFIFTNIAEEFGLIGALFVLSLYVVAIIYAIGIARNARTTFGKLVSAGMAATLFLYVVINALMIMGLAPVVGVPMPLLSFGGTAMLTIMVGYGLVLNVKVHRDQPIGAKALGY